VGLSFSGLALEVKGWSTNINYKHNPSRTNYFTMSQWFLYHTEIVSTH